MINPQYVFAISLFGDLRIFMVVLLIASPIVALVLACAKEDGIDIPMSWFKRLFVTFLVATFIIVLFPNKTRAKEMFVSKISYDNNISIDDAKIALNNLLEEE